MTTTKVFIRGMRNDAWGHDACMHCGDPEERK